MTEPVDTKALRELLYPATRTVYATMDIRKKTMARVAILEQLPALLEEVEQLRAANRIQASATELWMERGQRAEHHLAVARAALQPFADEAENWPDSVWEGYQLGKSQYVTITVGELRRARDVLGGSDDH